MVQSSGSSRVKSGAMRLYAGAMSVMVLAGCNCQPAQDECDGVTVTFASPASGATVNPSLDVEVRATTSTGTALTIASATVAVKGPGQAGFGDERDATTQFTKAVVTGLTLATGQNQLRATLKTSDPACSAKTATITVTARSQAVPAKVTAVTFPQDANGDGVLNASELPAGTTIQMAIAASDTTMATSVRALSGAVAVSVADATFSGGMAIVAIPVLSNDGNFELFAQLVAGGAAINTPTDNPAGLASIRVSRVSPMCALTNKDVNGPADDVTSEAVTFGLRATGTVDSTVVSSTVQIDAAAPVPVTASMGAVSTDFAVPKSGDTTYTLKLTATDAIGNACTATKLIRVDLQAPVVSISLATVTTDAGVEFITTTPIDVTITANGAADGDTACLYRQQGNTARQLMGCGPLVNSSAVISASFANDGEVSLIAEVQDAAKNTGTATKTLQVALTNCGLTFTSIAGRPAQCPAFVTSLSFGTLPVTLTTSAACASNPISLLADNTLVATTAPTAAGSANFTVSTVNGTHTFRGEIGNTVGPNTTVSCQVEVNTNAVPVFTDPPANIGQVQINALQDTQPQTAGAQRRLAFNATVPTAGRVEVCVNTNDASIVGTNAAACSDAATGWYVYRNQTSVTSPVQAFTYSEGAYLMRLVLVAGGGVAAVSADLSLNVDVTTPCVSAAGVTLPQDTNADNRLNIAEVGTASPQVTFTMDPACGTATSAIVRAASGSAAFSAAVTSPTGTVTIDLSSVPATADLDLFIELRDAIGNITTAAAPLGRKTFRVDRQAPACTFTLPNKTSLNVADVPGASLAVQVQTSSDVTTVPLNLGAGAPVNAAVSTTTFVAATSFALAGTGSTTLGATCTDTSGNSTTASYPLTYDLDAPTCAFTAPAANQLFTTNDITTTLAIGGAEGRSVRITSSAQAGDAAILPVMSGTATGLVSYPSALGQTLTALVSDAAGNACSTTVTGISINSTSCNLTTNAFANGTSLWLNLAGSTGSGVTRSADIIATSSNCITGQTVTLARISPNAGLLSTTTTNVAGVATFLSVAVTDGDVLSVSIDNGALGDGGSGATTTRVITADFTNPTVASVQINGVPAPATSLFFVAPLLANRQVQLGTAGYYADTDPVSPGGQFALSVNTIAGASSGGMPGSLNVLFKGTGITSTQSITSASTSIAFTATLPQSDTGAFVVRVTDQAGNSIDAYSQTATVDVLAPAKPGNLVRTLTSAREATVSIAFDPSGDDGAYGTGGDVKDYDVRWTTSSVNGNNSMATEADFFGSSTNQDSASAVSATRITRALTLPPINTYYVAVRARDEVDNYSTFDAPVAVANSWTRVTFTGETSEGLGATLVAGGSLNNDALADMAIGAFGFGAPSPGSVYVVYGNATLASQSLTPAGCIAPACTHITPPASTPANTTQRLFAFDLSMAGNVGDNGGELKPDLVVSQLYFPDSQNTVGRVLLYFGTMTATISPAAFIEIRGTSTTNAIGWTAKIIKDIDGDGLDEVSIGAPFYDSLRGRLYIFKGRSVSAWQTLRTSSDPTTTPATPFISVESADWKIDGPATGERFGFARFGVTSLGDLDGDGKSEFSASLGDPSVNKINIYKPGAGVPAVLQTLSRPEGTPGNFADGFGAVSIGGLDLLNGAANDLIATYPGAAGRNNGEVYIFADVGASGAPVNPTATITGGLTFGSSASAASINTSDNTVDLLIGQNTISNSNAWLIWNRVGSFATPIDLTTPKFWVSRFNGAAVAGKSSTSLGAINAIENFEGAGPNVALADSVNSMVYVWK